MTKEQGMDTKSKYANNETTINSNGNDIRQLNDGQMMNEYIAFD